MELADLILSLLSDRRASEAVEGGSRPRGEAPTSGGEGRQGPCHGFLSAFVGAGGKTSALYGLAEELAARGARVLVSTTTKIYDPRLEGGRPLERLVLAPELAPEPLSNADRGAAASAGPTGLGAKPASELGALRDAALDRVRALASPGKIVLLASETLPDEGKLRGVAPEALCALGGAFDHILVEADGSRRLPVKAPGPNEPVVPSCADLVVGCVGLDCLGAPIGADTVHRSELFAAIVGAEAGEPITARQLARLAAAPGGLFKAAPPGARRLVALNKAELLPRGRLEELLDTFTRARRAGSAAEAALDASPTPAESAARAKPPEGAGSEPLPVADAVACCSFAALSGRILALRRPVCRPTDAAPPPHPGLRKVY
jgi:probable selenium-dependent hydroxylase accessory protein YqeC